MNRKPSRQYKKIRAWIFSLFKREWRLEDYPVDFVEQDQTPFGIPPERMNIPRWRADIVGWPQLSGTGADKSEAFEDLRVKFEMRRASPETMYRPGTSHQPDIQFGADLVVSEYPKLRDEFITEILGLSWAWMSDESSLWDFHEGLTNEPFYVKIEERYHVDVRDIANANIAAILQKIATAKAS